MGIGDQGRGVVRGGCSYQHYCEQICAAASHSPVYGCLPPLARTQDAFPGMIAQMNGFQRHATLLIYLNHVPQVRQPLLPAPCAWGMPPLPRLNRPPLPPAAAPPLPASCLPAWALPLCIGPEL